MSFVIKSVNNRNPDPIEEFINNNNNYDLLSSTSQKTVDSFCSRVSAITDLTEIDKIVLTANYLQGAIQYCNGKITEANHKKYEVEYEGNREDYFNPSTAIEKNYGNCNAISCAFRIICEKLGVKVNKVDVGEHSYCIYEYNGKIYIIDPTFGCSRNENHVEGAPKATKFSDKYIMVSLHDLEDTGHHIVMRMLTDDPRLAAEQLDRNLIRESVEKLKSKGIKFEYPNKAVLKSKEIENKIGESEIEVSE